MSGVTMKAVILLSWPSGVGVRAMTVSTWAMPPLVIQRFWPLMTKPRPSAVGVAVDCTLAASLPASGSVRANALIHSPLASLGRYCCLLLLRAEQHDRPRADRVMRVDEQRRAAAVAAEHFQQAAIRRLREAQAAAVLGQAGAEDSELAKAGDHALRNLGLAVDRDGIDFAARRTAAAARPGRSSPDRAQRRDRAAAGRPGYWPKNRPLTKPTCCSRSPRISSASASCFSRSGAAMQRLRYRQGTALRRNRSLAICISERMRTITDVGVAWNCRDFRVKCQSRKTRQRLKRTCTVWRACVYNPALELRRKHQGGKSPGPIDGTERKYRPHPPRLAL